MVECSVAGGVVVELDSGGFSEVDFQRDEVFELFGENGANELADGRNINVVVASNIESFAVL